jgi:2-succinyl-5-enolpyruvyl-6-hydroxy-3-cyclohexene-1-carboxylate synthase
METVPDLQTQWARLIFAALVQAGLRDVVISPGSRSTPFALAALNQSALRCVSVIDERSAAHYALGQARASGRPSLLLCTSGSAPANYFPAVVEACEAGLPLLVLSADRPPELLGCGANQTTEQQQLFGSKVRMFGHFGEPRPDLASLRGVRRLGAQAVARAMGPVPGPVHLNAQARKPLEPQEVSDPTARQMAAAVRRLLDEPQTVEFLNEGVCPVAIAQVADALSQAERPLILCGPAPVQDADAREALYELGELSGAVIAAEATSQYRFGPGAEARVAGAFDALWRSELGRERLAPDFVLQLGASPVSKGWELLQEDRLIRRVVVHPWAWADPSSSAERMVRAKPLRFLEALNEALTARPIECGDFARRFRLANEIAMSACSERSKTESNQTKDLSQAAVAQSVLELAPHGSALFVGNSMSIRDIDTWGSVLDKPLSVFSQRGVSGIDGLVSAAAGVASLVSSPTSLLIGDVSFLHDLNGLQLASRAARPLVIIVVNNGGGRIFEQLPIASTNRAELMSYFTTPHQADMQAAAAVYGCAFAAAQTAAELRQALSAAYERDGCTVIEARTSAKPVERNRELWSLLESRLRREWT